MRRYRVFVVLLLAAAGGWSIRPAILGDAGGLWTYADQTFPAAAALRAQYLSGTSQAPAVTTAQTDKYDAKPDDKSGGKDKSASGDKSSKSGGGKAGPLVVVTLPVESKPLPLTIDAVGTVQAIASIAIRPRVDSQVVLVEVAEGAAVTAGDLLFRLDDRLIKGQLAQMDAQILKDQSQIDQAKRDLGRAEELLKQKFLAPQARETAATTLSSAKAQLAIDVAQRQGLTTQLSYTELHAPVSGRIGSIAAKTGTTVRSGDTLAIVNQIDPIYVSFALPQTKLGELRSAMAAGVAAVTVKDVHDAPAGKIAFLENSVDTTTGTVLVRAQMPNPAEKLWPGAFANIEVVTGVESDAIVVPSSAVQIGQKGAYVFVVRDAHAAMQLVTVSRSIGDKSVIAIGLEAGDQVVVKGQMGLTDGAEVQPPKEHGKANDPTKTSSAKTPADG